MKSFFTTRRIIIAIVAIALIILVFFLARNNETKYGIDRDSYQAVFLTNGQVYFGKIQNRDDYITMKDIYYLKAQEGLQSGATTVTTTPEVSLIKLGNELHGPKDFMNIEKSQVLFWENLKENSRVVRAIREYQER